MYLFHISDLDTSQGGVAVDGNDDILVAEWKNERVLLLDGATDGHLMGKFPVGERCHDVAVDWKSGVIYLTDNRDRMQLFKPAFPTSSSSPSPAVPEQKTKKKSTGKCFISNL